MTLIQAPQSDWVETMEQTGLQMTKNSAEDLSISDRSYRWTNRSKRLPKVKKIASRVLLTPKVEASLRLLTPNADSYDQMIVDKVEEFSPG